MENFEIKWSNENCMHSDECGCKVTLICKSTEFKGRQFTSDAKTIQEQFNDILSRASFTLQDVEGSQSQVEQTYFTSQIYKGSNIVLVDPPFDQRAVWPVSVNEPALDKRVLAYFKQMDYSYFALRYPDIGITESDFETSWDYASERAGEIPSLLSLSLRMFSGYHWSFGFTNGRPHHVSTGSNLYKDHKMMDTLLGMQHTPVKDQPTPVLKYSKEILRHYWRMVGADYVRKEKIPLSLSKLYPMYLGSAGGANNAEPVDHIDEIPIEVRPKGKKIDFFEQDLTALLEFIRTGKEPAVYFTNSFKNEYLFSFTKQWNAQKFADFEKKCRVFVIPSSIYILLERLISFPRHLRERGRAIRIGSKWSHGGADTLARILKCFDDPWLKQLFAGDVDHFDLSVIEALINLYWSTMLTYHDESDEDYPIFVEICKFLCKNQLTRLTNFFGQVWGLVSDEVPSGMLQTSHQDSFVMLIYFISYCVWTIRNSPPNLAEQLEAHFIDVIEAVVYGDDHVVRIGTGHLASYFSGHGFAQFVKRFYNVTIRDLEEDLAFLSVTKDGYVIVKGANFLKHYFVPNPEYGNPLYPEQSKFLPYRETRDVMIRVALSREVKEVREPLDILFSIVSHAYGTYASNRETYDRLLLLYYHIVKGEGLTEATLRLELQKRAEKGDLGKLRQMGITMEEVINGFPSWTMLIHKNKYDAAYQDNSTEWYDDDEYRYDDDY